MANEKTILIVDDERYLARMLSDSLQSLGAEYVIETVHNAEHALARLKSKCYNLLLTDYIMPGMNGLDLISHSQEISPTTRVILMTAYRDGDDFWQKVAALNITKCIDKPFSIAYIRQLVRDTIDQQLPEQNFAIV